MEISNQPLQESHPTTELPQHLSGEQSQHPVPELGERTPTQSPSFSSEPANTGNNTLLSRKELNDLRRQERWERNEQAERLDLDDTDEGRCKITTPRVLNLVTNTTSSQGGC